jgi:hypothetical protein
MEKKILGLLDQRRMILVPPQIPGNIGWLQGRIASYVRTDPSFLFPHSLHPQTFDQVQPTPACHKLPLGRERR